MANNNGNSKAAFSEMLEIRIDFKQFKQDLVDLKKMFADAMKDMGEGVGDAMFKGMGFSKLSQQMSEVHKVVEEANFNILKSHEENAQKIAKVQEQLATKTKNAAKETTKTVKQEAEEQREAIVKALQSPEGKAKYGLNSYPPPGAGRDIQTEQQGLREQHEQRLADADKKANERRSKAQQDQLTWEYNQRQKYEKQYTDWWTKELNHRDKVAYKKQQEAAEAQRKLEKSARDISIEQEGVENRAKLELKKQQIAWEREERKKLETDVQGWWKTNLREQDRLKREQLQREKIENKASRDAQAKHLRELRAADKLRRQEQGGINAARDIAIEQEGIVNRHAEEEKARKGVLAVRKQESEEAKKTATEAHKTMGFFQRVFDPERIKSTGAHLIRFWALWQGLMIAQQAAYDLFVLPFVEIGRGVKYLRDLEKSADELAAVMNQTLKFSDDFAENLRLSREYAIDLVKEFKDRAIAIGVDPDQMQNTFKALLEAGAGRGAKDLEDLVKLAEMFQATLKATGVGALAAQGSINELTSLFNGDKIQAGNKFLTVLRLSSREWQKIREEGFKYGDLVDRLAPRMEPYMAAVRKAGDTQEKLLAKLNLLWQRALALGVGKFFDGVTEALRKMNIWLTDNTGFVSTWFSIFSGSLLNGAKAIATFAQGTGLLEGVKRSFLSVFYVITKLIDGASLAMAFFNMQMAKAQEYIPGSMSAMNPGGVVNPNAKPVSNETKAQWKKQAEEAVKEWEKISTDVTLRDDQFQEMFAGKFDEQLQRKISRALSATFTNQPPPPSQNSNMRLIQSDLKQYEETLAESIDRIKAKYSEAKDAVRESLTEQKLNHKEAAEQIASLNDSEVAAIERQLKKYEQVAATYRKRVSADPGFLNDKDAQTAMNNFDTSSAKLIAGYRRFYQTLRKEKEAANRAGLKEDQDIARQDFEAQQTLSRQRVKAERDLNKELASQGLITALELHDKEQQLAQDEYSIEIALLNKRLSELRAGSVEYKKIADEKIQAEKDYTDYVATAGKVREGILREEYDRRIEYVAAMEQLQIEAQETDAQIRQQLNGMVNGNELAALVERRRQLIDTLIREKTAQYAVLSAYSIQTDKVRALRKEIAGLQNDKEALFASELENINNTSDSPVYRRIRERGAARRAGRSVSEQQSFGVAGKSVAESLFGRGFFEAWEDATSGVEKFAVAATGASGVLANLKNVVATVKQGYQEGGVMGAIGSGIGMFGDALSAIPVVGKFLPAIGGILTFVGGLFRNAAKKIAEDVKKSFQRTLDAYQNGNATLIETLNALERQRSEAIIRLSGKKGGKDELDKLLPEFDREITSLRKTQEEIITNFNDALSALRMQNDTLQEVQRRWADINKQVRDYIGAGGDAAKAQEYLSLSLAKIRQDAAEELADAEQEAIQDVLKLNDLLQQRVDLVDEFNKKEFDLINADAIERRQAGSVQRGKELEQLRRQHQQQLSQIDAEIALQNRKVEKEREVFNLAQDTAALRRRDEEITLANLDKQIDKWKSLKDIVSSITKDGNGFWNAAPGLFNTPQASLTISVTVTPPHGANPEDFGERVGDAVVAELRRQNRMVPVLM